MDRLSEIVDAPRSPQSAPDMAVAASDGQGRSLARREDSTCIHLKETRRKHGYPMTLSLRIRDAKIKELHEKTKRHRARSPSPSGGGAWICFRTIWCSHIAHGRSLDQDLHDCLRGTALWRKPATGPEHGIRGGACRQAGKRWYDVRQAAIQARLHARR